MNYVYDVFDVRGRYSRTVNCQSVAEQLKGGDIAYLADDIPGNRKAYADGTLHILPPPPTLLHYADPVSLSWVRD